MNKKLLIEQMEMLNINYLDFDGFNEVDYYPEVENGIIYYNLFDALYNSFIDPIYKVLETLGIEWINFHHIGYDLKPYAIFKDTDNLEYEITLSDNMQKETYNFIERIMNNNK